MSVVEVIGKVDGSEIMFRRTEGDLWQAQVPANEDFMYVMELYAVDEAGNKSYAAKVLFIYDASTKSYVIKEIPYQAVLIDEVYKRQLLQDSFTGSLKEGEISGESKI